MLDRYVTLDRLAVGGMGEVFLARQEGAGGFRRTVVLKRLLPDAEGNDDAIGRLLDEARVVAALSHENVVSIIEIGEAKNAREPPFLALEYVHGENCGTLRVRAYKSGVEMPVVVAARIVADVARGLHHAHMAKDVSGKPLHVVHRDVAPKNILVRHDGVAKITDFGIAWSQDRLSHTATGNVAGTLTYMSPEQVAGKPVDGTSDQFALGVVLWELLAGKRLFKAETPVGTVEKILTEDIEPPSHHRREVPPALDAVALRMLSRDAAGRFADCEQAARAIEAALPEASTTLGRAAVAAFLDRVMGEEMRARQKRIESGVAHPMYAPAPTGDARVDYAHTNSVTSSVMRATQTSATGNHVQVVAAEFAAEVAPAPTPAPSSTHERVARAPRGVLRVAAGVGAFVVGLLIAAAVFWPREDATVTGTRDLLVQTLDYGDLVLREMCVVAAVEGGVSEAQADDVAAKLVDLQRQRLRLLLAHWQHDADTRERERPVVVEREKALVKEARNVVATLVDVAPPETRWTWESSVPIRWVPPPSLAEIQRELSTGDELSDENRKRRWHMVERIARRAHIDPAFVRGLIERTVREREDALEAFKHAAPSELKALEDRMRALHEQGRGALKAKLSEKVAQAITHVAFVSVSESTEPDMWYDDEITIE